MSSQYHFKNKNIYSANPSGDPTIGYCCYADGTKEIRPYAECIAESGLFFLNDEDCPQQPDIGCCCACSYVDEEAGAARRRNATQWIKTKEFVGSRQMIHLGGLNQSISAHTRNGTVGPEGLTVAIGGAGIGNWIDDFGSLDQDPIGEVHVATYNQSSWSATDILVPSDSGSYGLGNPLGFGASVDIRGNIIAIGCFHEKSIYVFEYNETSWVEIAKISTPTASSSFGEKLIIGPSLDSIYVSDKNSDSTDGLISGQGVVYIYNKTGSSWPATYSKILEPSESVDDNYNFGTDVGEMTDKDGYHYVYVSSSPTSPIDGSNLLGKIHRFKYNALNEWIEIDPFELGDYVTPVDSEFGIHEFSLIDGELLIKTLFDETSQPNEFPARHFLFYDPTNLGNWSFQTEFKISSYDGSYAFTGSVPSMSSDYAIIPDTHDTVYVFERPTNGWSSETFDSSGISVDGLDFRMNYWGRNTQIESPNISGFGDEQMFISKHQHSESPGLTGCGKIVVYSKDESPKSGACCVDTSCVYGTLTQCDSLNGIYLGDNTDCSDRRCQPKGACRISETCFTDYTETDCVSEGGIFVGNGTDCVDDPHQILEDWDEMGACCVNGVCTNTTEADCSGVWYGPTVMCHEVSNCYADGTTGLKEVTNCECDSVEGVWIGGPCADVVDADLACTEYSADGARDVRDKSACCYFTNLGAVACENVCSMEDCLSLQSDLYPGVEYYGYLHKKCPGTHDQNSGETEDDEISGCGLAEGCYGACCYGTEYDEDENYIFNCEQLSSQQCFEMMNVEDVITDSICWHGCDVPCTEGGYQICGQDSNGCYGACCSNIFATASVVQLSLDMSDSMAWDRQLVIDWVGNFIDLMKDEYEDIENPPLIGVDLWNWCGGGTMVCASFDPTDIYDDIYEFVNYNYVPDGGTYYYPPIEHHNIINNTHGTTVVLFLSDGIPSDWDPLVFELINSGGVLCTYFTIGFGVGGESEEEYKLTYLADNTNGEYFSANDADGLDEIINYLVGGDGATWCSIKTEADCDGGTFYLNTSCAPNPCGSAIQNRDNTEDSEVTRFISRDISRNISRVPSGTTSLTEQENDPISSCCFLNLEGTSYSCSDSVNREWCESKGGIWNAPLDSLPIKCNENPCPDSPRKSTTDGVNTKYNPNTILENSLAGLNVGDVYQGGIYVGMFEPGGDVNMNGSSVIGNTKTGKGEEYKARGNSPGTSMRKWALILYSSNLETNEKELVSNYSVYSTSFYDGHYNIYGDSGIFFGMGSKLSGNVRKINLSGYNDWYIMSQDETAFVANTIKNNPALDFGMDGVYITSSITDDKIDNIRYIYSQDFTDGNDFGFVELVSSNDLRDGKFNKKYKIKLARRIYLS